MPYFENFNPTDNTQLIMGIIFFIALVIITVYGFATVYVLIKSGRSKIFSALVSLLYMMFFVALAAQGVHLLNQIK